MVPSSRENELVVLRCTRCGYELRAKPVELRGYTIASRSPAEERTITTSHVSEARRRPAKTLEEWEQEREEYREILLEQLQEELEGTEE
jgi:DNA-directed RNA polymerase subunit M